MKFMIHGTDKNECHDMMCIEADTIEEIQKIAKEETTKRQWTDCWSEVIDEKN